MNEISVVSGSLLEVICNLSVACIASVRTVSISVNKYRDQLSYEEYKNQKSMYLLLLPPHDWRP